MAVLTEEQNMMRDAARTWVLSKSPVTAVRAMRDSGAELGYDPAVWGAMVEMGWAGVIVPKEYGGYGFGYLSLGLILEETGRTLTASPLLASALGASALILGGSAPQKERWLPRIAAGELVAALAVDEGPHHAPEKAAVTATKSAAGYTLDGRKTFVLEGMGAGLLVVSARVAGKSGEKAGIELFLVPADATRLVRQRLGIIDCRGAANITFEGVEVAKDARLSGGFDLLESVLDRARAGMAAEMLGAATQAFETTLEYLKTRVQFGQVLGSFQALQHRAAEMFIDLELARSVVEAALQAIDADIPDVPELVSSAKARMGDAFHRVTDEMVQMHGGIGMTDAHDAGLYLKRARVCEAAFGNQAYHRGRYATLNGY